MNRKTMGSKRIGIHSSNYQKILATSKRQPHKMIKYTQIIRWQQPTNCLSESDHFVGLALKASRQNIVYHFYRSMFFIALYCDCHILLENIKKLLSF